MPHDLVFHDIPLIRIYQGTLKPTLPALTHPTPVFLPPTHPPTCFTSAFRIRRFLRPRRVPLLMVQASSIQAW